MFVITIFFSYVFYFSPNISSFTRFIIVRRWKHLHSSYFFVFAFPVRKAHASALFCLNRRETKTFSDSFEASPRKKILRTNVGLKSIFSSGAKRFVEMRALVFPIDFTYSSFMHIDAIRRSGNASCEDSSCFLFRKLKDMLKHWVRRTP